MYTSTSGNAQADDDPVLDIGPEDFYPGLDDGWPGDHCESCFRDQTCCNCYGPECCCWCGQMFDGNLQAAIAAGWRDLPNGLLCLEHDHDGDVPPPWMQCSTEMLPSSEADMVGNTNHKGETMSIPINAQDSKKEPCPAVPTFCYLRIDR